MLQHGSGPKKKVERCRAMWYNVPIALTESWRQEGGEPMEIIATFLVSVAAGVVCHLIGKWLDRHDKGE